VGDIAARYLNPKARAQIAELLKGDRLADGQPSGRRTLGEVASWADEIKDFDWGRRRGSWHYDDIPLCGSAEYASTAAADAAPRRSSRARWKCS